MERFHKVDDGAVIILRKGVWRQADLYRREDAAYARFGGGFIRLYRGGGTSVPDASWKAIDAPGFNANEATFSVTLAPLAIAAE